MLMSPRYLAIYCPSKTGRSGNARYKVLVDDVRLCYALHCSYSSTMIQLQVDRKWPWAANHPWHSWRERYKNHSEWFDQRILQYQKKKGIKLPLPTPTPTPRTSTQPAKKPRARRTATKVREVEPEDEGDDEVVLVERPSTRREELKEEEEESTQDATLSATPAGPLTAVAGPSQPRKSVAHSLNEQVPVSRSGFKPTTKRKRAEEETSEVEPSRKRLDKGKGKSKATNPPSAIPSRAASMQPQPEDEDAIARKAADARIVAARERATASELAGTQRRLEYETEVEGAAKRGQSSKRTEQPPSPSLPDQTPSATRIRDQLAPNPTHDQDAIPLIDAEEPSNDYGSPPLMNDPLELLPPPIVTIATTETHSPPPDDVDDGLPPGSDDYRGEVFEVDEVNDQQPEAEPADENNEETDVGEEIDQDTQMYIREATKTPRAKSSLTTDQALHVLRATFPESPSPAKYNLFLRIIIVVADAFSLVHRKH